MKIRERLISTAENPEPRTLSGVFLFSENTEGMGLYFPKMIVD